MQQLIRDAKREEAPFVAWAFMCAVGQEDNVTPKFIEICRRDDTLYSYQRARICEVDGTPAGCLLSYPGEIYHRLRQFTWQMYWPAQADDIHQSQPETYPDEYYLDTLAVLPSYRRAGIGAALLADGIKKGQALGFSKITLLAETPTLIAFYQRLGFEPIGSVNFFGFQYTRMQYVPRS